MKKYDNFCKALDNLQEGLKLEEPYSIVEKTGLVGLFEICFEQAWKMIKETLEKHGLFENKTGSPRAIIKLAYQAGMINDQERWLAIMDARNLLAHTYSDDSALKVIRLVKSEYASAFIELKTEIDERWLDEDK